MARVGYIAPEEATGKTKELYDGLAKNLPKIFNVFQAMGNNPAVLNAYMQFSGALKDGVLGPKFQEKIAVLVAEKNGCHY